MTDRSVDPSGQFHAVQFHQDTDELCSSSLTSSASVLPNGSPAMCSYHSHVVSSAGEAAIIH
jgi:hypothetical protein